MLKWTGLPLLVLLAGFSLQISTAEGRPQTSACATSGEVLAGTIVVPVSDLTHARQMVSPDTWASDAVAITSASMLSGQCVSKVDGFDGSNLGYAGGNVIQLLGDGLQEVPQGEQKGIHARLLQRTHNSPGAPVRWAGGTLASGVQLGAGRCSLPTGIYLSNWQRQGSAVLGVYSRDASSGAMSDIKQLATVNGTVRAVGYLPSADTDDGQLFLSIENGATLNLVTVRLTGIEGLIGCP